MSIYDQRDEPAYNDDFHPYHNRNIDKWWTDKHDQLILTLIDQYQWGWYWELHESIEDITPKDVMDTLTKQYAWYNKVMKYGLTRAKELGFTKNIRKPQRRSCLLCGEEFIESSLPQPFLKRLGVNNLVFCSPCLKDTVLQNTGNENATNEEIIKYLNQLANVIEKVPTQGFGEGVDDLSNLDSIKLLELLKTLNRKPTVKRIKAVFGSWFNALVEAGVLQDGARQNSRGIQTIAKDGHNCFSLGERTIDDFLYNRGIAHQREPKYPDSNYRADFLVGNIFIEYFGLAGNPEYDKKTKDKKKICRKHGVNLISLYPKDLMSTKKLEGKLMDIL